VLSRGPAGRAGDRPVILGQIHNGQDALPWPAGVQSGANHPGARLATNLSRLTL
jgi:hypothetical protein